MSLIRRNFPLLFIGNALAQGLSFFVAPLLTRIYSPIQFGVLGIFVASINMMAVLSTARYHEAIVLPNLKKDAHVLTLISFAILAVFTIFVTVLSVFYGDALLDLIGINYLKEIKYFALVGLVFFTVSQILNSWLLRCENFTSIIILRLAQSAVVAIIAVILGLYENEHGLIFAEILGYTSSTVVIIFLLKNRNFHYNINWRDLCRIIKEYKAFPTVNLVHNLIDILQPALTMYLIGKYYGFEHLGWYVFALRMLRAPLSLVGNSFGQLIYKQMINDRKDPILLKKQVGLYIMRSFLLGGPVCILIIIFAKDIFGEVFGSEWSNSGALVSIMSPWIFIAFTCSLISNLPNVLNEQRKFFFISIIGSALNLLTTVILAELGYGFVRCISMLTLIMSLYSLLQLVWLYKTTEKTYKEVL